jgi:hypothetical protein
VVEIALLIVVDSIELFRATLLRIPAFFRKYHGPFAITDVHGKGVSLWFDVLDKAVLGSQ